jgi:L-cysteate sulfo-lyase
MDSAATASLSAKIARYPRLGLAQLPTPLQPLKRLSAYLGGPSIWVKHEDATGLTFGGNKLRKLDYLLDEAIKANADTLVSGGVVQSNSLRQVAAVAAKLGLECHLAVYHGRLAVPTAEYSMSGNMLLNRLFGARLHNIPWTGDRNQAIYQLAERLRADGRKPYEVSVAIMLLAGRSETG